MSPRLERALRWSATCHAGQTRKGGDTPYFEHAAAVAMILDRAGFDEDVVIAGLLHDVVEDTDATLDDVATRFGPDVSAMVRDCSEVKLDAQGASVPGSTASATISPSSVRPVCRPAPSSSPTSSTT